MSTVSFEWKLHTLDAQSNFGNFSIANSGASADTSDALLLAGSSTGTYVGRHGGSRQRRECVRHVPRPSLIGATWREGDAVEQRSLVAEAARILATRE